MTSTNQLRTHTLGLKGLRPVIAYLAAHPDKTHLIAVKEPKGVHNLIVTPKSSRKIVTDLQKLLGQTNGSTKKIESLIQTI